MSSQTAAMLITVLAHLIGLVVMLGMLVRGENVDWSALWPRDDDDDGGWGWEDESGPSDDPDGDHGLDLPLGDAEPAARRLRGRRPAGGRRLPRRHGRPAPDRPPVVPPPLR